MLSAFLIKKTISFSYEIQELYLDAVVQVLLTTKHTKIFGQKFSSKTIFVTNTLLTCRTLNFVGQYFLHRVEVSSILSAGFLSVRVISSRSNALLYRVWNRVPALNYQERKLRTTFLNIYWVFILIKIILISSSCCKEDLSISQVVLSTYYKFLDQGCCIWEFRKYKFFRWI